MRLRIVAFLFSGAFAAGTAHAAVLNTITVDGNMADWSAVLAEPAQVSLDGPAGGLPDLDAPIPSTGRDLSAFAWTYDSTHFFMYLRRVGSAKNLNLFWYYLDLNADQRMSSGEFVFHVSWWGNTRRTQTELFRYNAASPAGDPMVDGAGVADGYTMPGSITSLGAIELNYGGSASGFEMEARVPWSLLAVAAGTPFFFHVSSSNGTSLPGQIHDNLGGPGGMIGTTHQAGVTFQPDRVTTGVPAGVAVLAHTLTHTGYGNDTFDLTWSAGGDFLPGAVDFYADLDADGALGPVDLPLVDTDGDSLLDSGSLGSGESLAILVVVAVPTPVGEGMVATVTTTATSSAAPSVSGVVVDTVTVATPAVTLVKSVNAATAVPGDVLTYTVNYASNGSTDAYDVVLVDAVPMPGIYVAGSASGAGAAIAFSHDGGATFDASEAAPVTHVRWTFPTPLAPGMTGSVSFSAEVP